MGASGFVGSHVARKLVARGDDVRVYLRRTSSTIAFDDLDVERHYGDLRDAEALRRAMADCDVVYYCVVDTRFHLRDPSPLYETNVNSLLRVLDVAAGAGLSKFVYCSTVGTVAVGTSSEPANEDTPFNWAGKGGAYIESRRAGEDLVLQYARGGQVPAVVVCCGTPYGPRDWNPSQGMFVQLSAFGKLPVYLAGVGTEVVGVEDLADGFLLAAERGRVGERYIVSETYMSMRELFSTAARAAGAKPPRFGVPVSVMRVVGIAGSALGALLRRDVVLNRTGQTLMETTSPLDHSKAVRELGWNPRPTTESIERAARWYVDRRDGAFD